MCEYCYLSLLCLYEVLVHVVVLLLRVFIRREAARGGAQRDQPAAEAIALAANMFSSIICSSAITIICICSGVCIICVRHY